MITFKYKLCGCRFSLLRKYPFYESRAKGYLIIFNLLGSGTANYSFSSIASSTISDVWKNVDYFGVVYYNSVLDLHYQKPEKKEGAL